MFSLDKKQIQQIADWKRSHECSLRTNEHGVKNEIYVGAIGGAITYCFTPTGLGDCVEAQCACGEKINVTAYDEW